jgi:integrase
VSGNLQVRGSGRDRKYFALWIDADGVKHTRTLGRAHVKDTGRRTSRGAASNPSADAERVSLVDDGALNILEPAEFEVVYRAALGQVDERQAESREPDAIDELTESGREMFAAALATKFYAGLRMGETRDLQWHCVDFSRSLLRVQSAFVQGERSTPKSKRSRSAPLVPVLAERLAAVSTRARFTSESDYVFCTDLGGRVADRRFEVRVLRGARSCRSWAQARDDRSARK